MDEHYDPTYRSGRTRHGADVLQRFDVADLGIDARADLAGRIAAWIENRQLNVTPLPSMMSPMIQTLGFFSQSGRLWPLVPQQAARRLFGIKHRNALSGAVTRGSQVVR
jgi:hypothetical protein